MRVPQRRRGPAPQRRPGRRPHYVYGMSFMDAAPSIFACFDQPDLKAPFTLHVRGPRGLDRHRQRARPSRPSPGVWELAHHSAAVDVLRDPRRRALPRGPRRARRHPAGPVAHARASPTDLDADADELFTMTAAVLRRVPPALRHPLPVRRLPPGVRARVQRRRDGEPRLRDLPRPAGLQQPGHPRGPHHPRHHGRPRDGAPVVRQPRPPRAGGTTCGSTSPSPSTWATGSPPTSPSTTTPGSTTPTRAASGGWSPTSGRAPTRWPATAPSTPAARCRTSTGSPTPRAPRVLKQLNAPAGRRGVLRRASSTTSARTGSATPPCTTCSRAGSGPGPATCRASPTSWLRTAGADRLVARPRRRRGSCRTPPADHPADRTHTAPGRHCRRGRRLAGRRRSTVATRTGAASPSLRTRRCVLDPYEDTWARRATSTTPPWPRCRPCCPQRRIPTLRAGIWNALRSTFHDGGLAPERPARRGRWRRCPPRTATTRSSTRCATVIDRVAAARRRPDGGTGAAAPTRRCRGSSPPRPGSVLQLAAFQAAVRAAADGAVLRGWLDGRDLPAGARPRPRPALADPGPARDARAAPTAPSSGGTSTPSPPPCRAVAHVRAVASLPGRRGQGLRVGALHRARSTAPNYELEAAGLGMWRAGQEDLTAAVRRPVLRRAARHRRRCAPGGSWPRPRTAFFPMTSSTPETLARGPCA